MKKVLKSRNKMLINNNSVEDSLILSYEYDFFKKTDLYASLKKWSDDRKLKILN